MNGVEREIGGGKEGAIGLTGADNDRAASRGLRWDHALTREREGERESSASFASYTTMWPSGDADGLIITKEPASHIAGRGSSKMKIHLGTRPEPRPVRSNMRFREALHHLARLVFNNRRICLSNRARHYVNKTLSIADSFVLIRNRSPIS